MTVKVFRLMCLSQKKNNVFDFETALAPQLCDLFNVFMVLKL